MSFARFFVDRPIFATVVSILITIMGGVGLFGLPIAQYPDIAPPTISVSASYPGADAVTVADTVATPIEQEVNGVDGMIYMTSQSTSNGDMSLSVTFEVGTDVEQAQVLVQNRVAIAEPRLPTEVTQLGITTQKQSPDLMMVIHLLSPDNSRDQLYISNYATLQVRDVLARIGGVGEVTIFGARDYSMRIWLDPERMAARNLVPDDVLSALRGQNVQVAGGVLGQPPIGVPTEFQTTLSLQGRLSDPEQFDRIIVKADDQGRIIRLRDVAEVEIGAQSYSTNSYLNNKPAVAMGIFQKPGSNALATADALKQTMDELSAEFPQGVQYQIVYNPTDFIAQSIDELVRTILEAVVLVVLVILIFLQTWRASIIPIVAIPVSLIGTFVGMSALGFSINNLTLFGLVLAVGIVVDDAIVVVENVERKIREGIAPRQAARETVDEVGGALIATSLVLLAVFVPTAFITGISGQFYQQFAVTIATATTISLLNSLTLSPALCAVFLKSKHDDGKKRGFNPIRSFFDGFNRGFEALSGGYAGLVGRLTRIGPVMLLIYAGLIAATVWGFQRVPTGFIPDQDSGYFITAIQLPPGASLARTDAVADKAQQALQQIEGVKDTVAIVGFSGATFTSAPDSAAIFVPLDPFAERLAKGQTLERIMGQAYGAFQSIPEAQIFPIQPPAVSGIGSGGGFKMMVQDRQNRGVKVLEDSIGQLTAAANQEPGLTRVFTSWRTNAPQIFMEVDRVKAEKLNVPVSDVFSVLETYVGSAFVNDFNLLGRTYRVTAQAQWEDRVSTADVSNLKVRNEDGDMVPLGAFVSFRDTAGPDRMPRFNLYNAAEVQGSALPGVSSGEALNRMEALANRVLPYGIGFEWTELSYQEKAAGNTAAYVFGLAVIFVFLVLAAQYESWTLPVAIVLIVPMCLFSAIFGVMWRGMDNNILTQIGLVVLIALASKNAILIVEVARSLEDEGKSRFEAAMGAARLRLRPILMTSFAFILGVVPLMIASGAGAEMRQALGTAVFFGMLGVTFFGLIFTPSFYTLVRRMAGAGRSAPTSGPTGDSGGGSEKPAAPSAN